jgi:hypothetical protein
VSRIECWELSSVSANIAVVVVTSNIIHLKDIDDGALHLTLFQSELQCVSV